MFYVVVNWYNESKNEDTITHLIVVAEDWNDATQKITGRFCIFDRFFCNFVSDYCRNLL